MSAADPVRTLAQDDEHTEWLLGATNLPRSPDMPWERGGYPTARPGHSLLTWSGMAAGLLALGLATTIPSLDTSEVVTVTNQVVQQRQQEAEPMALEDTVGVMPPKSIMRVKIHVRSVTKAKPLIVAPDDY